jgi:dUTPase
MDLTREQILSMAEMQNTLNSKIHPQWFNQNFDWFRAIMVESVEGLDHYGWKWWKAVEPNMPQVQLELVDIWHFMLSQFLKDASGSSGDAASAILRGKWRSVLYEEADPRTNFERLVYGSVTKTFSTPMLSAFGALVTQSGLGWDGLYFQYISKNVLNTFRQDHGYKSGGYIKDWGGKEDNEVLVEIMVTTTAPAEVYAQLEARYPQLQAA